MLTSLKDRILQAPIKATTILILILSAFWYLATPLDIAISSHFYDADKGFWLRWEDGPRFLRSLGMAVPRGLVLLIILFLIARLFYPRLQRYLSLHKVLFLFISAALGPGLLVNLILKANWGRARPVQTDLFGGEWPYSEVWVIAGNCQSNCSFVSGEGAMGFWLPAVAILLPLAWRKVGFWSLALFGAAISINRIAFGGHYTSDILMAWALTGWVMLVTWHYMTRPKYSPLSMQNLEQNWTDWGQKLKSVSTIRQ